MVVKKAEKEQLPAAIDYGADAGAGFEGTNKDDFSIPFLSILQSGSPQCKKSDGAYIKGAEEGMLFNSVTDEILDGDVGVVVIPCAYQRRMLEWVPKDSGGGFRGEYLPEEAPQVVGRDEKGKDLLANGNNLSDTRSHFVLLEGEEGLSPVLLSMASTQLKKSKRWMSLMQAFRHAGQAMPMFARRYRITTIPESNEHGSWFGWKIVPEGLVTDASHYQQAKDFREAVTAGAVKVERNDDEAGSNTQSENAEKEPVDPPF